MDSASTSPKLAVQIAEPYDSSAFVDSDGAGIVSADGWAQRNPGLSENGFLREGQTAGGVNLLSRWLAAGERPFGPNQSEGPDSQK